MTNNWKLAPFAWFAAALYFVPAIAGNVIYVIAGAVGRPSYLYSIARSTGAANSARLIIDGGIAFSGTTTGLTHGQGEILTTAGAVGTASYLYKIDPGTGVINSASLITAGHIPFIGAITGLAYVTAVPEPGSLALFGLGLTPVAATGVVDRPLAQKSLAGH